MERQGYTVTSYSYSFPPSNIRPPLESYLSKNLVIWNALGIQSLYALAWLNLHKKIWEYDEIIHNKVMEEV